MPVALGLCPLNSLALGDLLWARVSVSGSLGFLRSSVKEEAGPWNEHGAVAGEEQKSDNPGLELCDPEPLFLFFSSFFF